MSKKTIGIILTIISFILLIPGIYLNIFELTLDTKVDAKLVNLTLTVLEQKRSILGTVGNLIEKKRYLVGILIFLFSVAVPLLKGGLVIFANIKAGEQKREKILNIVNLIGKWSMADVFVVAIFLAFLATTSTGVDYQKNVGLMGMQIPVKINSLMTSTLGSGFYFFLGYCLVSMIGMYFFKQEEVQKA